MDPLYYETYVHLSFVGYISRQFTVYMLGSFAQLNIYMIQELSRCFDIITIAPTSNILNKCNWIIYTIKYNYILQSYS